MGESKESSGSRTKQRVVAALAPDDRALLEAMRTAQYAVTLASSDRLDVVVHVERARLVVADERVPGVLEAVARLRRREPVPVVLLAEGAVPGARALESGADVILPRPVTPEALVEVLESMVSTAFPTMPPPPPSLLPPKRRSTTTQPSLRAPPMQPARSITPVALRPSSLLPSGSRHSTTNIPSATVSKSTDPPVITSSEAPPGASAMSWLDEAKWLAEGSLHPPDLRAKVEQGLRDALREVDGDPSALELTAGLDDGLDDVIPPELLEPLEGLVDDDAQRPSLGSGAHLSVAPRAERRAPREGAEPAQVVPLPLDGDVRIAGHLERRGLGPLLAAAWRVRASGEIVLRDGAREWQLSVAHGHLLSLRSSQADEQVGPLLARLGFVPMEAARFAAVPLDAGPRGAAMLAAQGYVAADALLPTLARAAQEVAFDLLCIERFDWEIRPRASTGSIPFTTRPLDALLVAAARARIEPAEAFQILGGDGTELTLRADAAALAALPLTASERAAATAANRTNLAVLVRGHGDAALPALAALLWLGLLRSDGAAQALAEGQVPPGPERTRLRALQEAAARRDMLVLLGVSAWATQRAALGALEARRAEADTLRSRFALSGALAPVYGALDEAGRLLADHASWERYVAALRVVDRS